jgi:hypothetical protein
MYRALLATISILPLSVAFTATPTSTAFRPHNHVHVQPASTTSLSVVASPPPKTGRKLLQETELPDQLYFPQAKEVPKVAGGLKIGTRKLVCVTGASSGLGLNCAATLAKSGDYFVIMAVRDVEKAKRGEYVIKPSIADIHLF